MLASKTINSHNTIIVYEYEHLQAEQAKARSKSATAGSEQHVASRYCVLAAAAINTAASSAVTFSIYRHREFKGKTNKSDDYVGG